MNPCFQSQRPAVLVIDPLDVESTAGRLGLCANVVFVLSFCVWLVFWGTFVWFLPGVCGDVIGLNREILQGPQ